MRVLLTAFQPFDGTGLNSSLEGCRAFLDRKVAGVEVRFAVLPVVYGADTEHVEREQRPPAGAKAGFLHVPCLPEQAEPGTPALTAGQIGAAIHAALSCYASG